MSQTGVELKDVQATTITISGVTVGFTAEQVRALIQGTDERITELSRQLGITQGAMR
jgi:ABC-type amino acid transport system permease subunit